MSFYVWIIAWWWATSSSPAQLCSVCMMCNSCAILAWGNENLTSLGKNSKPPLWFKLSPWVLKCHEITASSGIWCSRVCCFPKPTGTVKCAGKAYKYFNIASELLRYSLTNKEFWILKALQNAQMHEAAVIKLAKLPNTNLNLWEPEFSLPVWEGVLSVAVEWPWRKLLNEARVSQWEGRGTSALLLFSCLMICVQKAASLQGYILSSHIALLGYWKGSFTWSLAGTPPQMAAAHAGALAPPASITWVFSGHAGTVLHLGGRAMPQLPRHQGLTSAVSRGAAWVQALAAHFSMGLSGSGSLESKMRRGSRDRKMALRVLLWEAVNPLLLLARYVLRRGEFSAAVCPKPWALASVCRLRDAAGGTSAWGCVQLLLCDELPLSAGIRGRHSCAFTLCPSKPSSSL